MWGQYEKSVKVWLLRISNKSIQAPGNPPVFTLNHPPTLEASTRSTKNISSYINCTQFDFLPLEILHNIDMWHAVLVHCNQLKPILVRLTQHRPVLLFYIAYDLKYFPFG